MPNLLQSVFVHPSHTSSATQNRGINTRTRTRSRFTADLHMPRFAPPSGLLAFSLTFSQGPFPLELRRREPVSGFYCIFSSTLDTLRNAVTQKHCGAKASALRINLNIQGCSVVAPPLHAPSRAPLLLPLLLSHNIPLPRVH